MNNKKYKIPIKGSLGILALGDVGITEWRKIREESLKNKIKNEKK